MIYRVHESNGLFEDEKVIEIEIERLRSFKDHPFKVTDDKEMHLLKDSIKQYGVLNPLIVRPVPDGVYEIISGHRRKYAAQQLGYRKVPVIIRVMNDEEFLFCSMEALSFRSRISSIRH
ncbi:MAG TPA: ParB/RepB/Spo0J family partition protein [Candidatus Blautia merdigallinarum]|uniref:ParB/RepB/Spo0J family partition protein n=1 Tax=Candidatus Blautia merdigallinarum TaxID=2838495 RepID=A0A9D2SJC5_9FIRM|nr:ParB/RepB/Spo0J family partition protein [Candidatus Blautia merdigallinarum]